MLGLRHVAWALPEKLNWLKSVALIFVTIDLTSQYKITSLTWFGTEILSLCGLFSQLTEQIFFTPPSYQFITSCCLLSPVQILEETHPSVHGSSFSTRDPDTVITIPVSPDPAGKVSTSLFLISFFEQFAAPMRRFTQVHCRQTSFNSHLISSHSWLNELIRSGSVTCGILISILLSIAGLVLAGALSPAVHGSSHGLASFSGYPPPHVVPQHHSSPDIHTHHHNTSSTIFTPAGSWGSDPYLPSGSGLSAVTQDKTELEFLSVDEVMKVDSHSLSWTFIFKPCLDLITTFL